MAQTNSGIRSKLIPVRRILTTVVMNFTAPRIDEIPAKWSEKRAGQQRLLRER